jgi:hypothetical protein
VTYQYTDAANYHLDDEFIVAGEVHFADIEPFLDEGEFFLPSTLGIPDLWAQRLRIDPDDDHPWHRFEFEEEDFKPTKRPATSKFTAESLIAAFKAASEAGWSDEQALTDQIAELAEPFVPEKDEPALCENCSVELQDGEEVYCTDCHIRMDEEPVEDDEAEEETEE